MSEQAGEVYLGLKIYGSSTANVRQVAIGLGKPTILIDFEVEEGGRVGINVTTGAPFDQNDEGILALSDMFLTISEVLSDDEFREKWKAHKEDADFEEESEDEYEGADDF